MSIDAKKIIVSILAIVFLGSLLIVAWVEGGKQRFKPEPEMLLSEESTGCYNCHKEKTPAIVNQWIGSRHGEVGIGCYECHKAEEKDIDAWKHNGRLIATIVTPKDCGRCHEKIADEFSKSSHARAADVDGSIDALLAEKLQGKGTAAVGCQKCHGVKIDFQMDDKGKILKESDGKPMFAEGAWPNTGMGRINPDGSRGACTACHSRHRFDISMARRPEACGKCHTGPDHPQEGIYEESKHGVAFNNALSQGLMKLDKKKWVVGVDYSAAPTCATCHMSASPDQPMTHNTAQRIAWNCRPPVSVHPEDWEVNRVNMQSICLNCHSPAWVDGHFKQYDTAVELWNNRFGEPGTKIMDKLAESGLITQSPFDDPIEWTWYFLWHRDGRQARMGSAMMGPSFAQWEGFAEVARTFYGDFLKQARDLAKSNPEVSKFIESTLKDSGSAWPTDMGADSRAKITKFYQDRYKQNVR
ncbi:MAG: hydroxylamine oxidoreductase [Planctomycetes bacterium]|nr:hydroxylamine oxidoreductase [Planctomycetota bacterium]